MSETIVISNRIGREHPLMPEERDRLRNQTARNCWDRVAEFTADGTPCVVQFGGWTETEKSFMGMGLWEIEARLYVRPVPDQPLVRRREGEL